MKVCEGKTRWEWADFETYSKSPPPPPPFDIYVFQFTYIYIRMVQNVIKLVNKHNWFLPFSPIYLLLH
jgi:hypothetical protein